MQQTQAAATVLDAALPKEGAARRLATGLALVMGVCLLTLSAKTQVPFWPVPMTMQSLVVVMIGMAYGRWLGLATVIAYLAAGAAGLPVFAGTPERGIGLAYMAGPTAGFLAGFVAAAWLAGALAERGLGRTIGGSAAVMLLGHAVLMAAGLVWLTALFGTSKAIAVGLTPFLAATVVKVALGALFMPLLWRIGEGR